MNTAKRYFFKKEDRLKSRKAIDAIFRSGKSFSNFPFKVMWLPVNNAAVLQTGIGVSSRNFKKATDRNRIKRLLREAYRLQKNSLYDHLLQQQKTMSVFILYTGKELPGYDMVYEKTGIIINRLIKFSNENDQAHT